MEEEIKSIVIPEVLTIKELSDKMKIVPSVIVKKLFMQGKIVTVNQEIDYRLRKESRWNSTFSVRRRRSWTSSRNFSRRMKRMKAPWRNARR